MIRVFIVDDHSLLLEGIQSLLLEHRDVEVIGSATTAAGCLQSLQFKKADVVLMDIGLPDMSGLELCAEVKSRYPYMMVLALSSFHDGCYVKKMMSSGASGYIFKDADCDELVAGIRQVNKGKVYLSFGAGKALSSDNHGKGLAILTRREKQVLALISNGYTNPQIARKLYISLSTADSHRKHLLAKLKVKNTALLIRLAIEQQLI